MLRKSGPAGLYQRPSSRVSTQFVTLTGSLVYDTGFPFLRRKEPGTRVRIPEVASSLAFIIDSTRLENVLSSAVASVASHVLLTLVCTYDCPA
jgi:hypothetical protein